MTETTADLADARAAGARDAPATLSSPMGSLTRLLVLFLVPVTMMMHNFWAVADPMMAMTQQVMFMKNVSMLGAALLIAHFGSGPLSMDGGD